MIRIVLSGQASPGPGRRPGRGRLTLVAFSLLALLSVSAASRSFAADPLMFCVHPYLPASEIEKRFEPLLAYLSRELRTPVNLHIPRDYHEHIKSQVTGIAPAEDRDYDALRAILREMKTAGVDF